MKKVSHAYAPAYWVIANNALKRKSRTKYVTTSNNNENETKIQQAATSTATLQRAGVTDVKSRRLLHRNECNAQQQQHIKCKCVCVSA